ncbi:MAG: IS4 family transposase, partial [Thermaerobacter sp.]|nr:IS4 family transposase [Thermaerobacter sp.]
RPPLTLRDAVRARAKLGGFLGRNRDGEPGVKTWWRGYRQLPWLCWWDEVPRSPS